MNTSFLQLPDRNLILLQGERWRPPAFETPRNGWARWRAWARRLLDLQAASIWRDLRALLPQVRGDVLDVGCGAQPYREFFGPEARYRGIDYVAARESFGYQEADVQYYAGDVWPVASASVAVVLATETLEHVPRPEVFLAEAARCLEPGGYLILTVPFAARWHYIPHDYYRFTPSSLQNLLSEAGFENVAVYARGNSLTVACYKLLALIFPLLFPQSKRVLACVLVSSLSGFSSPPWSPDWPPSAVCPCSQAAGMIAWVTRFWPGELLRACATTPPPAPSPQRREGARQTTLLRPRSVAGRGWGEGLSHKLWEEYRMLIMEPRPCPVCGSRDESRVFAPANLDPALFGTFSFASRKLPEYMHARLIECPTCDVVYANPAIAEESLASAYEEAAFDSAAEAGYAARTYVGYLTGILPWLSDRDGALDIGTGEGSFLRELLRAGFRNVVGVEPSRAPVAAAALDVQPLIRQEMFQRDTFRPESFRLITCFQTIEHLRDPLVICRDVFQALKPGGAFFLIGHNRRALSAAVLGRKSPIFDVEHLQLFSPHSFRQLLRAAGFGSITVAPILNRYPVHYWARLFPFPKQAKGNLLRWLKASFLGRVLVPLPAGNLAVVGFKPHGAAALTGNSRIDGGR